MDLRNYMAAAATSSNSVPVTVSAGLSSESDSPNKMRICAGKAGKCLGLLIIVPCVLLGGLILNNKVQLQRGLETSPTDDPYPDPSRFSPRVPIEEVSVLGSHNSYANNKDANYGLIGPLIRYSVTDLRDNTPLMMLESMGKKYYERVNKLYKRITRHR